MGQRIITLLFLFIFISLIACSGGGGSTSSSSSSSSSGGAATTTTFPGGSLDDLKALSSSLTFDILEISGKLDLPHYTSETITVNTLNVTSSGSIGYSYSTCTYVDAPSITINAAGDVNINGDILLKGRSGTSVSASATCNSCYGQDGGDIVITSVGNLNISGRVMNGGGGGATIRYVGFPSSACNAGASGNLTLNTTDNTVLTNSDVDNKAGKNFDDVYGASGIATITTGNQFTMTGGSISTTGTLNFTANMADISGSITYGSLNDSIGGTADSTNPIILINNPLPNETIAWNTPFQIQVQASDDGMGLRNVHVTGFGHDQAHFESEFVNGVLSIDIPSANSPTTLSAIATDNKGLQSTALVQGITISYPQESEPNDSLAQAQTINSGGLIDGDILTGDAGYASAAVQTYLQNNGDVDWATRLIEDVYAVTLSQSATNISISMDFTGNSNTPDIDIYLLNSNGTVLLTQSVRDNIATSNYTESINYTGTSGATYYLVLQAFNVTSRANYRLTRN